MRFKIKLKLAKLRLLAQSGYKQAQKLALAVVILEYLIAGGYYLAETRGYTEFLKPKTVIIEITRKAEAKEQPEEIKEETIEDIIERVSRERNFDDAEILIKIAQCESSLDRYARNPKSSARGLFQILDMHQLTEAERYNPEIATNWAITEIEKNGLSAWNSSKHCWNK